MLNVTVNWLAVGAGALASMVLGFVATAMASHAMYHANSLRHYLINAGYYVANLAVMGLIIGAFLGAA